MRTTEPKPPRYNRYYVYLVIFGVLLLPIIASWRMRRACGHALYGYWPPHRCTVAQTWQWLQGGGNWEAWLLIGLAASLSIAFIVDVLRD